MMKNFLLKFVVLLFVLTYYAQSETTVQIVDDISFVDDITINQREFDSLEQREIEFYPEDLEDGKVVVQGLLESTDDVTPLESLHVEITTDGGDNWSRASGNGEWEWSFRPELEHTYEFSLRVVQETQVAFATKNITVAPMFLKYRQIEPKVITVAPMFLKYRQVEPKVITVAPMFLKYRQVEPKVITVAPMFLKYRQIEPKVITVAPMFLKFKGPEPKVITTEPIVLKFKKFTPKVITTEPIVLKFKKFTPKVITTEPIILKFKQDN